MLAYLYYANIWKLNKRSLFLSLLCQLIKAKEKFRRKSSHTLMPKRKAKRNTFIPLCLYKSVNFKKNEALVPLNIYKKVKQEWEKLSFRFIVCPLTERPPFILGSSMQEENGQAVRGKKYQPAFVLFRTRQTNKWITMSENRNPRFPCLLSFKYQQHPWFKEREGANQPSSCQVCCSSQKHKKEWVRCEAVKCSHLFFNHG